MILPIPRPARRVSAHSPAERPRPLAGALVRAMVGAVAQASSPLAATSGETVTLPLLPGLALARARAFCVPALVPSGPGVSGIAAIQERTRRCSTRS